MKNRGNIFIPAESEPISPKDPSIPRGAWKVLSLPLILFISLPIVALFLNLSTMEVFSNLRQTAMLQAVTLSLITSLATTFITLILGTPVAYYLSHSRGRFARWVDTVMDLPTVLPPSVAGLALLLTFGRKGLFGPAFSAWGISIPFTTLAVILAQTFIAAPYYVKAAAIGFANIDAEIKQAAALDGADGPQTFAYVTLPLSWHALLSGAVMTWARALGEFGATIIFAGNFPGTTQTMPLAIYIGFQIDISVAITLAAILIIFSFFTLILVKGMLYERLPETEAR